MGILSNIVLSSSVSVDTMVLGLSKKNEDYANLITKGLLVAFVQSVFFGLGACLGETVFLFLEQVDHWLILIALSYFGFKTIFEEHADYNSSTKESLTKFTFKSMAASLDAIAIGFSLSHLLFREPQFLLILFFVTLMSYLLGFSIVSKLQKLNFKFFQWFSGLIIFGLGLHIFLSHMLDHGF